MAVVGLLGRYRDRGDVVVLALPRGGVPVGYEVATALGAPLDVFLVRKLGVPGREELVMGAIASGGVVVTVQSVAQRGAGSSLVGWLRERNDRIAVREREKAGFYGDHRLPPTHRPDSGERARERHVCFDH